MFEPRWYQLECHDALFQFLAMKPMELDKNGKPKPRNPLIAMPTGTGKSVVIAMLCATALRMQPTTRFLMLTHVKELVAQNAKALLSVWPTAPVGIVSAGLNKKEYGYPITYAGVATVKNSVDKLGRIDIICIDEAHLLNPNADTMYQELIEALKKLNPWLIVIGLTATPYRMGIGSLTNNGIFTDTAFDLTTIENFNRLVNEGYMAPLIPKRPGVQLDLSKVGIANGDYKLGEMQTAVDQTSITDAIVRDILMHAVGRKSGLFFAAGIEHAEHVSECFEHYGVKVPVVHSKMDAKQRDKILEAFKHGEFPGMVGNNIFTTGFDHPPVDLIGMLRPTLSAGLWVQMLGRGTRPSWDTGKRDCLVLDYAGNTPRLGPINDPAIPKRKLKGPGGEAPVWCCPQCQNYNHARAPACIYCGCVHDMQQDLSDAAGVQEVMRGELPVTQYFRVNSVMYFIHQKEGKPDQIRIMYQCGMRTFTEWVQPEHGGMPSKRYREWWRQRSTLEPPDTTAEALLHTSQLKAPERILVWVNTQYPRVLEVEF